ncbi:hypothetical protein QCA50_019760 [Cerrena zonata]|uniref:Uncharacterized protein n=1 Tax=Cerrena zonata TaxID=2478898 RepID=A0AAW0FGK7_9APHY
MSLVQTLDTYAKLIQSLFSTISITRSLLPPSHPSLLFLTVPFAFGPQILSRSPVSKYIVDPISSYSASQNAYHNDPHNILAGPQPILFDRSEDGSLYPRRISIGRGLGIS